MGFFKDLKKDISQAVNELLPESDAIQETPDDQDDPIVNTLDSDPTDAEIVDSEKMKEWLDEFTKEDNSSLDTQLKNEDFGNNNTNEGNDLDIFGMVDNLEEDLETETEVHIDVEAEERKETEDGNQQGYEDNSQKTEDGNQLGEAEGSSKTESGDHIDEADGDEEITSGQDMKETEDFEHKKNNDDILVNSEDLLDSEEEILNHEKVGEDVIMEDNVDLELLEALNEEEETVAKETKLKAASIEDEVTIITKGTTIEGNISSVGSLEIMGSINGDVECLGKLTITGTVTGNSTASEIYVNTERLEGSLTSEGSIKVGLGTVIIGDINATSGVIAGAVKGEIDIKGPVVIDSTAIIKG